MYCRTVSLLVMRLQECPLGVHDHTVLMASREKSEMCEECPLVENVARFIRFILRAKLKLAKRPFLELPLRRINRLDFITIYNNNIIIQIS